MSIQKGLIMYDIPNFSRYYLGTDYKVYNKETNNLVAGSLHTTGYVRLTLINDEGISENKGLHFIVATALVPKPELIVNHKDSDKENNHPDNLEWVTYSENRLDAFKKGNVSLNTFVQVKDNYKNEILFFSSLASCGRYFNLHKTTVLARCNSGDDKVWPGGFQFRSPASKEPFPIIDNIEDAIRQNGTKKAVLVRNLQTKEEHRFEKIQDAGAFLGLKQSSMSGHFLRNPQPVVKEIYQLRFDKKDEVWSDPVDITVEVPVKVITVSTNTEKIYPTARAAALDNGLKPSALNYRLDVAKPDKVWSDGKKYFRLVDNS